MNRKAHLARKDGRGFRRHRNTKHWQLLHSVLRPRVLLLSEALFYSLCVAGNGVSCSHARTGAPHCVHAGLGTPAGAEADAGYVCEINLVIL